MCLPFNHVVQSILFGIKMNRYDYLSLSDIVNFGPNYINRVNIMKIQQINVEIEMGCFLEG